MAQARINYTPPTTRGNGAQSLQPVDIAGYRVERLPNSGGVWAIYGSQILPGNDIVVEVNLGDAHQYRVSTVDTGGRVGSPSAAVEIRFDAIPNILPPDFPTNVSVTYL